MFGRRVPPHIVFLLSLLLAVVCGLIAYTAYNADSHIPAGIAGIFSLWFAIDAVRSYMWTRKQKDNEPRDIE